MVVSKHYQEKTQYVVKDEQNDIKMEIDIKRNKKNLLDQRGQYSIWMNQRPKGGGEAEGKTKERKGGKQSKSSKGNEGFGLVDS